MNEQPAWTDESLAGSLFPRALPRPPRRVITYDWTGHPLPAVPVREMRERHDAHLAHLDAVQQREETPEEREVRWKKARESARFDMRRERQRERIAAGIEQAPDPMRAFDSFRDAIAKVSIELSAMADVFAGFGRAAFTPQSIIRATAKAQEEEVRKAALGRAMIDAPPFSHDAAQRAMRDFDALTTSIAPKPPPARERYLPGTRHAHKGGRR